VRLMVRTIRGGLAGTDGASGDSGDDSPDDAPEDKPLSFAY
jgi:cytochrome d ubiquinol oxidase subunit I